MSHDTALYLVAKFTIHVIKSKNTIMLLYFAMQKTTLKSMESVNLVATLSLLAITATFDQKEMTQYLFVVLLLLHYCIIFMF